MPDLFSFYTLEGITLRNRIAMSPMTMYRSIDGVMNDFHVMLMGSRAAGGFGLVFTEQLAITPDGRTGTGCADIYDDSQIEGLSRVTAIIKDMGLVRGPSAIPYGGRYTYPVHALTIGEIKEIYRSYARAAQRALDAGFEWLETHFAHGYLGASFFSPLANCVSVPAPKVRSVGLSPQTTGNPRDTNSWRFQ